MSGGDAGPKNSHQKEMREQLRWIMAHVKRMSNKEREGHEDYEDYYEEMEWRLVHDQSSRGRNFIKVSTQEHRLPFKADDLKVLIFPNDETKKLSLSDVDIIKYFTKHMPSIVTLDECNNF